MSSNAKHYDYYMVEGADVKKVIDAYDDIQKRRNEILGDAMKKVGAVAFTTTRSWGAVGGGICEEIDGRFPDIDRVIPKETKAAEEIGFNAGYLVDIGKVAKLFNPKFCGVKFELNGSTDAAVCCLSATTGETAKIVVMPMRL